MDHHHPMIKKIEKRTGIDMRKVIKLGNTMKNGNFEDENHLRKIVKQVGGIAGKKPSKKTEDTIISAIERMRRRKFYR